MLIILNSISLIGKLTVKLSIKQKQRHLAISSIKRAKNQNFG